MGSYIFTEEGQKWMTWKILERLAVGCDLPWLCAGDLNEIMHDQEKRGQGGVIRRESQMRDFWHCIEDCGLRDTSFVGHPFTWTNKKVGRDNIQERLDIGLANSLWTSKFPHSWVFHLTRVLSDHFPLCIDWLMKTRRGGRFKASKFFRFEAH